MADELVYIIYARELKAKDRSKHMGAPEGIPRISNKLDNKITEQIKEIKGVRLVHSIGDRYIWAIGYKIKGDFNPAEVLGVICSNGCAVLTKGDYKSRIWREN